LRQKLFCLTAAHWVPTNSVSSCEASDQLIQSYHHNIYFI
jgi:hypothetical protein